MKNYFSLDYTVGKWKISVMISMIKKLASWMHNTLLHVEKRFDMKKI